MYKKCQLLLFILFFICYSINIAGEEKGVRPQYKIVIGEDRSVKVFDMQGNLLSDKPQTGGPENTTSNNNEVRKEPSRFTSNLKQMDSTGVVEEKQIIADNAPGEINTKITSSNVKNSAGLETAEIEYLNSRPEDKNITFHNELIIPDTHKLQLQKQVIGSNRIEETAAAPNLIIYTGPDSSCSYDSTTHLITFNTVVGNTGDGNAGVFRVGWYLSSDTTVDTGDTLLLYDSVGFLNAGNYINTSGSIDLDTLVSLFPGTYYPGVIIDYMGQVSESNENDNTGYWNFPISWPSGDPNLTLYTGTGADNIYTYDTATHLLVLYCSVENDGPVSAGAFGVGLYLSDNTIISSTDILLADYSVSGLAPGAHENIGQFKDLDDFSCSALPSGPYYVGFLIDYQNTVSESDETDNDWYFASPVNWLCGKANLTEYTGPGSNNGFTYLTSHHRLNLSFSVQNNGDTNAGGFRIGWYVSGDTDITTGDYFVDSYYIGSLSKGAYITATASKDLDGYCGGSDQIPPGEYYVGVFIDDQFNINEFDEDDNRFCFTPTINYIGCYSNLKLYTGARSDNTISYDDTSHIITFHTSVENNGNDAAGEFRIGWYLSANDSITTFDYLVTTGYVNGLAVGSFVTKTNNRDLDEFCETSNPIPPNTYYAGLIIDYQDEVTEGYEHDNNYYWSSPQVTFGCTSSETYNIGGTITYYKDSTIPVDSVKVDLTGDSSYTTRTNASGHYEFVNMPAGICSVSVSRTKSNSPEVSISPFDASYILRYYVNDITLTEAQKIAADVSNNAEISPFDASIILRYVVGQDVSAFDIGNWKFIVPPVTDWLSPIVKRYYAPLKSDQIDQNFEGILIGDASGNYAGSMPAKKGNGKVVPGEIRSLTGELLELPVRIEGVSGCNAVGFELEFNKAQLQVENVSLIRETENAMLAFHERNGALRVAVASADEIKDANLLSITLVKTAKININNTSIRLMNYEIDGSRVNSPQEWNVTVERLPEHFDLKQNYPNPFNPSTNLSYSVAEKCDVKLIIYNTLGQKVRELLNTTQNAGNYKINWDGRDEYGKQAPSGIYIVQFESNNYKKAVKIIKTK